MSEQTKMVLTSHQIFEGHVLFFIGQSLPEDDKLLPGRSSSSFPNPLLLTWCWYGHTVGAVKDSQGILQRDPGEGEPRPKGSRAGQGAL